MQLEHLMISITDAKGAILMSLPRLDKLQLDHVCGPINGLVFTPYSRFGNLLIFSSQSRDAGLFTERDSQAICCLRPTSIKKVPGLTVNETIAGNVTLALKWRNLLRLILSSQFP